MVISEKIEGNVIDEPMATFVGAKLRVVPRTVIHVLAGLFVLDLGVYGYGSSIVGFVFVLSRVKHADVRSKLSHATMTEN